MAKHPAAMNRIVLGLLLLAAAPGTAGAAGPGPLPRYDLRIDLDTARHVCTTRQLVSWTNRHRRPATELVFNAHSHYKLPEKEVGMTAKIFEILRTTPRESLDEEGRALEVGHVYLEGFAPAGGDGRTGQGGPGEAGQETLPAPRPLTLPPPPAPRELPFCYRDDNDSALVVSLPRPVGPGETVTIAIEHVLRLPEKYGRWGHWKGITFLTNWLPVLAYYDDEGWHPTPYVVWHQPFFNEAGYFTARLTLPADQKVACTASVAAETDLGDGRRQIAFVPCCVRDFAILCCACYREHTAQSGAVRVRCLAVAGHEHYGRIMAESAAEVLDTFTRWFGPYPYPEFTVVESYFGWHSNECAGLVMIDARIFDMPHLARGFVDYLIAQATCHQWWYNVVGTNGYSETWMDEGLATYFAYRLMRTKYGHNDPLVKYPTGLQWLPNVNRNDYRYFNLYGTLARGEAQPTVQDIPKYGHIVDLYSMCYERGSKIVGMIEQQLGEPRFFEFMQRVYRRHAFGILRVAAFQRDLEEYTGASWDEFFRKWVYGKGLTDWCIDKVSIKRLPEDRGPVACAAGLCAGGLGAGAASLGAGRSRPCKVTVVLRQKAEYNDPTVVGFCLDGSDSFQVRLPVAPETGLIESDYPPARIETLADNCVRVEVELPCEPTQIVVDPDEVLVDRNPENNCWKPRFRVRFAPVYTFLDETDLTNAYDRWNITFGPWIFAPTYDNPWFTRSTRFGVRAGAYRTQQFEGGAYAAYRTDYRDFVTGIDGILDHWPFDHTEVGFVFERRLAGTLRGEDAADIGVLYGRYVIDYGDSLYLPPFQYVETFTTVQDDLLPFARETVPGATRFQHMAMGGLHYHINYLTPYWDPEGGFSADLSYALGLEVPGIHTDVDGSHQLLGQATYVQPVPDGLGWFSLTRFAFRLYGAFGLPSNVQYFALGGSELFRGFDLAQRQGSSLWVGSVEWRVPLALDLHWTFCDRAIGLENIYAAAFSDVGNVYLRNESVGGFAKCAGIGLRLDVSWFTFMERTIIRLDVARTIDSAAPTQVWAGIEHPF
jgi:hypothetical protein